MILKPSIEFQMVAAPSDALRQRLIDLAATDNPSVVTPGRAKRGKDLEREEADEAAEFFELIQTALDTQQRIAELTKTVETIDQASLMALLEAEERLREARRMANRATDGRRVYETEDGRAVFDEQGNEVGRNEIDLQTWNPDAPTWEVYSEREARYRATKDFHARVREQKARLEDDLSAGDLDEVEEALEELERDMPANVRAHYERLSSPTEQPRATSAATAYTGRAGFESATPVGNAFAEAAQGTDDTRPETVAEPAPARPGHDFTL